MIVVLVCSKGWQREKQTFFFVLELFGENRRIRPLSTELTALFRLRSRAVAKNWFPVEKSGRAGRAERASEAGDLYWALYGFCAAFSDGAVERESLLIGRVSVSPPNIIRV